MDWQRSLNFGAGTYVFTAEADDGVRFYLDGVPLIDSYSATGNRMMTVTRVLAAGPHALQVQYVEYNGQARLIFGWIQEVPTPTPTLVASATPVASATLIASATPVPSATHVPIATDTPTAAPRSTAIATDTPLPLFLPPPLPATDTVTPVAILIVTSAAP